MRSTTAKALLLSAVCACASGKDAGVDITKPVTGAEASNAAKAYEKGMQEKKDQNPMEATRFFEYVRNNFPYSQYASLSQLAIADMSFDRDDWSTAASQYQDFVKSHPSHPKADYAAFRVGQAYFNDRPSTIFFLPPSFEKDQAPLRQALEALNRFVNAYPKSEYMTKGRAMIADCRELLAAHERYVGEFYWKREQWRGAAGRFMTLADSYGDLRGGTVHGESLWRAALAYRNAKDPARERKTLQRLVQEAPQNAHRKEAETLLQKLPANPPAVSPAAQNPSPEANEAQPETPSARGERPQAAPGPGMPPAADGAPQLAPPEGVQPSHPANEPAPAPAAKGTPSSPPELAPPGR